LRHHHVVLTRAVGLRLALADLEHGGVAGVVDFDAVIAGPHQRQRHIGRVDLDVIVLFPASARAR
jgi:hypothetical protein